MRSLAEAADGLATAKYECLQFALRAGQFFPRWRRVTVSPARCGPDAQRHRQSVEYLRDRRVPSRLD